MLTITWNHLCDYCHHPIIHGKPTLMFATDKPLLLGLSHATCSANKYSLGLHQMLPPDYLTREQVAFLIQFYPMLYALPNALTPNVALRQCMADLLHYYPLSMIDPMKCLYDYREMHLDEPFTYEGDLEADYIRFLAKVQKAAKENPVDIEFDFP